MRSARGAGRPRRQHGGHEEGIRRHEPDASGKDTDHRARDLVQDDPAADDRPIAAEVRSPELLSNHHHVVPAAWPIVVRVESPPQEWRDSQHPEEFVGHLEPDEPFRRAIAAKVEANGRDQRHRFETGGVRAPVQEDAAGNAVLPADVVDLGHHHQSIRFGVRERTQEHGIEHAVDRGVRADTERQSEGGGCGEPRASTKKPAPDHHIPPHVVEHAAQTALSFVPLANRGQRCEHAIGSPELGQCPLSRVTPVTPFLLERSSAHLEVKRQLGVDVGAHFLACARGEREQPLDSPGFHRHLMPALPAL